MENYSVYVLFVKFIEGNFEQIVCKTYDIDKVIASYEDDDCKELIYYEQID